MGVKGGAAMGAALMRQEWDKTQHTRNMSATGHCALPGLQHRAQSMIMIK